MISCKVFFTLVVKFSLHLALRRDGGWVNALFFKN